MSPLYLALAALVGVLVGAPVGIVTWALCPPGIRDLPTRTVRVVRREAHRWDVIVHQRDTGSHATPVITDHQITKELATP